MEHRHSPKYCPPKGFPVRMSWSRLLRLNSIPDIRSQPLYWICRFDALACIHRRPLRSVKSRKLAPGKGGGHRRSDYRPIQTIRVGSSATQAGLECIVLFDRSLAGVLRFHDEPPQGNQSIYLSSQATPQSQAHHAAFG